MHNFIKHFPRKNHNNSKEGQTREIDSSSQSTAKKIDELKESDYAVSLNILAFLNDSNF